MSSNFLNMSGAFAGVDRHLYLSLVPPSPIPVPVPFVTHIVGQIHPVCLPMKVASSVTTDATPVVQKGWEMRLIPHIFIPPAPPHPAELVNLAAIILLSTSAPKLAASTVKGEGSPLLVEELDAFGINLDCADAWLGFGADINFNTVKTTPTLMDYIKATIAIVWGSLKNRRSGKKSNQKFEDSLKKATINTKSDAVKQALKHFAKPVAKEALKQARKFATDAIKDAIPTFV